MTKNAFANHAENLAYQKAYAASPKFAVDDALIAVMYLVRDRKAPAPILAEACAMAARYALDMLCNSRMNEIVAVMERLASGKHTDMPDFETHRLTVASAACELTMKTLEYGSVEAHVRQFAQRFALRHPGIAADEINAAVDRVASAYIRNAWAKEAKRLLADHEQRKEAIIAEVIASVAASK